MEEPVAAKGTVTSLASMFPVEEAQKAVKHVEEAIEEKQKEMERIKGFISDNNNLINLVSKLPDELHHDIMVPFGKAAFFPGRLIHTNEFLVLLGEGYYAERTAKQTVEILKRRGKALDSQVESLKANVKDLRAEASFFDATASEAAEGLVEIREEYVEENSSEKQSKSDNKKVTFEDDEYARIMSRLDELEKEELAAEGKNVSEEDEETSTAESDESDKDEPTNGTESDSDSHEYTQTKPNFSPFLHQTRTQIRKPPPQTQVENSAPEALSTEYNNHLDIMNQTNCTGLTVQPAPKGILKKPLPTEKPSALPEVKEKVEAISLPRNKVPMETKKSGFDSSKAFTDSIVEHSHSIQTNSKEQIATSSQPPAKSSPPGFDSSKAFTGSIMEHTRNMQATSQEQSAASSLSSSSQSSRPVSRFKMQRR